MIDALALVIVPLIIVIGLAALAGGVLGWLLGSRSVKQDAADMSPTVVAAPEVVETPVEESPEAPVDELGIVGDDELSVEEEAPTDDLLPAEDEPPSVATQDIEYEPKEEAEGSEAMEVAADEEEVAADEEEVAADEDRDEETPHTTPHDLERRIVELEHELERRDHDLMRLETGATAAWDQTVPSLERIIDQLKDENRELRNVLGGTQDQLESMRLELDLMRKAGSRD